VRELTKSLLSFTWSMSVFGLSQAVNLLSPQRAASAFDDVTRRTEEQLGSLTRSIFSAGDRFQRSLVDLTFGSWGLDRLGGGCSSCSGSRGERQASEPSGGWGPIPPPRA
jgi:hypothetical protein